MDLDRAVVTVPAASAKSRKAQRVPLRADLVEVLRSIQGEPAAPVFPASRAWRGKRSPGTAVPSVRTFEADVRAAGIDPEDGEGRVLDFHSLRGTLASDLVRAGVHPAHAQRLLRHASITTTMRHYVSVDEAALREAVEKTRPDDPKEEA